MQGVFLFFSRRFYQGIHTCLIPNNFNPMTHPAQEHMLNKLCSRHPATVRSLSLYEQMPAIW